MASYKITNKSNAQILAELQSICWKVGAFEWNESGEPVLTCQAGQYPDQESMARVAGYFARQEYKKFQEVA